MIKYNKDSESFNSLEQVDWGRWKVKEEWIAAEEFRRYEREREDYNRQWMQGCDSELFFEVMKALTGACRANMFR